MTGGHYSRSRVRGALGHFVLGKLASGGLGIVFLVLALRWLPQADYGAYAALIALQVSTLSLSSLGIEPAAERFVPELRVQGGASRLASFVTGAMALRLLTLGIACLVFWMLSGAIAAWSGVEAIRENAGTFVLWVFSFGFMQSLSAVLEALLQQRWSQVAATLSSAMRLGMLVGLASTSGLVVSEVLLCELLGAVTGAAVALSGLVAYFRREPGLEFTTRMGLGDMKARMLRFATFNYSAQFVMQGYGHEIWRVLAAKLLGLTEAARYGFVVSMMETIQKYLPATLLIRMIRPVFVSRYAANRDFAQLNVFASLVLKLNLLVLAPMIGIAVGVGATLIPLLTKGKYADADILLGLVLLLLVPASHQWVISILANTLEKNSLQFQGALVALIGMPVGWFAVSHVGLYGVVLGVGTSAVLYNSFVVLRLRGMGFPYRQDLRGVIGLLACGGVAWLGAAGVLAVLPGLPGAIAGVVVGGVGYGLAVILLRPFTRTEFDVLSGVVPAKFSRLLAKKDVAS